MPSSSTLIAHPAFARYRRTLLLLVLRLPERVLVVFVSILDRGVQAEAVLVLAVLWPFVEAFQRRFEGFEVFLIPLTLLAGGWEDRSYGLLIAARGPTP